MKYGFGPFFEIETARDMFAKLEREYERLKARPRNSWVAFNVFVTANHIVEGMWPHDRAQQKSVREGETIPRICDHLANGATHLRLDRKHDVVTHADVASGPSSTGYDSGFAIDDLVIDVGPLEAKDLGTSRITAVDLACRVLGYWRPLVTP